MSTQIIRGLVQSNVKSSLAGIFTLVIFFYASKSDTMREEPDMINDALLVMILLGCLLQDRRFLRNRQALCYLLVIAICIKLAYFYDNTTVMASPTHPKLLSWKQKIQSNSIISTYLPLIGCFLVELRVNTEIKIQKIGEII